MNEVFRIQAVTSGVRIDPRGGTVDFQRTAIEHLGETRPHLQKKTGIESNDDLNGES